MARDSSVAAFVTRVCGRAPVAAHAGPKLTLLEVDDCPAPGEVSVISVGLGAVPRTLYRGLRVGFELVATTRGDATVLRERLTQAIVDERSAAKQGTGHLRVQALPPRGVMHNGAFRAARAPHLLFAAALSRIPALVGRHRIGAGYVEFLPAVLLSDEQLADYDASPSGLIARLAGRR